MSVLVNGAPAGFFHTCCGLCQGDPFSPWLFILVMEALSKLLSRAVQGGLLEGFKVGMEGEEPLVVSHLLYANNALIFCGVEARQ